MKVLFHFKPKKELKLRQLLILEKNQIYNLLLKVENLGIKIYGLIQLLIHMVIKE